ncbi:MAG: hypothetical protein ACOC3J_02705, partial [Gemmatimonadota bacterium]
MKLRTAFFLSLLAVLVIMAVPAFLGVGHVREVRRVALDLRQRTAEAAFVVGRIQAGIERLDRYQRAQVATGDPELAERTRLTLHELERSLRRLRLAGYAGAVQEARVPIR